MMACSLITMDKEPGVQLVGIGDIIWQLCAKFILLVTGPTATEACGNLNLCARLGTGTEGDVQSTLE